MRTRHVIPLLCLIAAIAGCGGGSTGASSTTGTQAADLVNADTIALVSINTDQNGDQWRQANELLDRFPGREKLLARIRKELAKEGLDWETGVKPALGPELDVAVAYQQGQDEPDVVALVKPDDPAKLKELADKADKDDPTVRRELEDGWWALSDTQAAIDRVVAKPGVQTLADQQAFQDAIADQPDEALVNAYVNGPRIREVIPETYKKQLGGVPFLDALGGIFASVQAVDEGLKLSGTAHGAATGDRGKPFKSTFLDEVPSGALLFATFKGGSFGLDQLRTSLGGSIVEQIEQTLGVTLEDIQQLLGGEIAIYVRPAALIPEVTFVATTDNEARAKATLDKLAQKVAALGGGGATRQTDVGGITFTQIPLGGLSVSYAVHDGRIIVTDLPSGAARLGEGGDSLADDEDFKAAKEAAGMPDETSGFVYVNVADALSVVEALSDEEVPADVRENLRPLQSLLLYASKDGDNSTFGGFLGIGE